MTTQGIPSIAIGTPTTPGANLHLSGMGYQGLSLPNPGINTLTFNFNSTSDLATLSSSSPDENASTSLDISKFIKYGHKIIWYHGLSDPRVPVVGMISYYNDWRTSTAACRRPEILAALSRSEHGSLHWRRHDRSVRHAHAGGQLGRKRHAAGPNHCDEFGSDFSAATYQVVGNYITVRLSTRRPAQPAAVPVSAASALYRQDEHGEWRNGGDPFVAARPALSNYVCIQPPQ